MSTFPPKNFENQYNEQMREMHGENQKHESPVTSRCQQQEMTEPASAVFIGANMAGLTPKQEAFCQAYIETGNASEAYRKAYAADRMKPESVNRKAKELLENGKITARIAALQGEHRQRHNITVDDLLIELRRPDAQPLILDTAQASAAVGATMGKGYLGWIR